MKKILSFFIMISMLSGFFPVWADGSDDVTPYGLGISIGYWINGFDGTMNAGSGSTTMSFRNDLGLPRQNLFVPEIFYRFDHGQILDLRYQQYGQTVTQSLGSPQSFQGATYPAGKATTANLNIRWADIAYEIPIQYDQFPPHDRYLNLLLDIQPIKTQLNLSNASGASGNQIVDLTLPLLGVHGKYRIFSDTTSLEFRAAGTFVGFVDSIVLDYNLEAGISQRILNDLDVTGKIRYFKFHDKDGFGNITDFHFFGPELDAVLQF